VRQFAAGLLLLAAACHRPIAVASSAPATKVVATPAATDDRYAAFLVEARLSPAQQRQLDALLEQFARAQREYVRKDVETTIGSDVPTEDTTAREIEDETRRMRAAAAAILDARQVAALDRAGGPAILLVAAGRRNAAR